MKATIATLHVYPVKSARAIDLQSAVLTDRGLKHDRGWVLVDARGRFQTQRELPQLATLRVTPMGQRLLLEAGAARCELDLHASGPVREVRVWQSDCLGIDCGDDVAAWLGAQLGQPLRLLRFDPSRPRLSDPAWTGAVRAGNAFSDGYPLLVINSASLADLNTRLGQALPMNRFRPNLVLDGLEAWAEDRVAEFAADGVRLRPVKPCARCIIPTTDQDTGVRGSDEVLRALRGFRFDAQVHGVTFGWNAIIVEGVGRHLSVGQELDVRWRS